MQLAEQIPNDPPRMGAKCTTTSNHSSTPVYMSLYNSYPPNPVACYFFGGQHKLEIIEYPNFSLTKIDNIILF